MSRLLPRRFFALVPIPELEVTEIATGARPSCDTRPGLRSRPLGRRSGCSSAEPYPPPRPFFSLRPSCLSPKLLHPRPANSPTVSCLPQQAIALSEDPHTQTGNSVRRCYVSERIAHPAKPISTVPFPLISIGGTGTVLPSDHSSCCQPAAVRLNRPARSSDSSTSPRRSFLTPTMTRSFARVSAMPCGSPHRRSIQGSRAGAMAKINPAAGRG